MNKNIVAILQDQHLLLSYLRDVISLDRPSGGSSCLQLTKDDIETYSKVNHSFSYLLTPRPKRTTRNCTIDVTSEILRKVPNYLKTLIEKMQKIQTKRDVPAVIRDLAESASRQYTAMGEKSSLDFSDFMTHYTLYQKLALINICNFPGVSKIKKRPNLLSTIDASIKCIDNMINSKLDSLENDKIYQLYQLYNIINKLCDQLFPFLPFTFLQLFGSLQLSQPLIWPQLKEFIALTDSVRTVNAASETSSIQSPPSNFRSGKRQRTNSNGNYCSPGISTMSTNINNQDAELAPLFTQDQSVMDHSNEVNFVTPHTVPLPEQPINVDCAIPPPVIDVLAIAIQDGFDTQFPVTIGEGLGHNALPFPTDENGVPENLFREPIDTVNPLDDWMEDPVALSESSLETFVQSFFTPHTDPLPEQPINVDCAIALPVIDVLAIAIQDGFDTPFPVTIREGLGHNALSFPTDENGVPELSVPQSVPRKSMKEFDFN